MPELPEVEIIKLGLQKRIIGLKIQKIQVLSPKSFIGNPDLAEGQIVLKVWRKAKILGVDLTPDSNKLRDSSLVAQNDQRVTLLFHLKMSGQLIWKGESGKGEGESFIGGHPTEDMLGEMPNPHTRVIFTFSDGSRLYFNDQRKFGWIKISNDPLKNLGPEPLEKNFTWEILKQNLLKHKKMPVKVAIMDQSVVAGVGNIYANEACFNAKIDPRTKVGDMDDKQFQVLYRGVIRALRDGIKHGGSTRTHFLDYAYCYGRNKHPCKVCGTEIKKIQLRGRGTYFCPACQS